MKITVTQEHINRAEMARFCRRDYRAICQCPIAMAMKEKFPDDDQLRVMEGVVVTSTHRMWLPDKAKEFIRCFDAEVPVSPIEFEAL